jgi:hypothetical protein
MTTDRDPSTRIVLSWLREDAHENAERALLRALDEVETTPQCRSWWAARRFPTMNAYAKLAIAAAAVLLVAVVGYQFLPSNSRVGGVPNATPSQTSAAATVPVSTSSPAPTASLVAEPQIPEGSIAPGTYSFDEERQITVDVPAGWAGCCGGGVIAKNDFAGIMLYIDISDIKVYNDPCHWSIKGETEPRGVAAIAAALSAQPTRQGSQPRNVTVGGLPGMHVRLTVPAGMDIIDATGNRAFPDCDQQEFRTWTSGHDAIRHQQGSSQIDDVYLVPVGSRIVAFDVTSGPDIAPADKSALDAMLASIRIVQP